MIVIGVRFLCNIISISFFCVYNDIHVLYVCFLVCVCSILYCGSFTLYCVCIVFCNVFMLWTLGRITHLG